jgi:hypothetical protein
MSSPELPEVNTPKEPLSSQQAYQIEYYKKNKEKFLEKNSERYRNLTPDEKKQNRILQKAWYQKNKDAVKLREYKRYWEKRRGFK